VPDAYTRSMSTYAAAIKLVHATNTPATAARAGRNERTTVAGTGIDGRGGAAASVTTPAILETVPVVLNVQGVNRMSFEDRKRLHRCVLATRG
jgi:hypothetical protein